ncbi:uncharacterized protein [Watersipora subatra]|uniref:uncharacterized protein n=1 Tax=Watersipora subatra TaxID=2589382 RepID=UPI00355BDB45
MDLTKVQPSASPSKVSPRHEKISDFVLDKQIKVRKDVNGIAVTQNNVILLALGAASRGGIGRLDIETTELTVHHSGTVYRQITVANDGTVLASTRDSIYIYPPDNLEHEHTEIKLDVPVWGLCQTPDSELLFGSVNNKRVYRRRDEQTSTVVKRSNENKLQSVWSLASIAQKLFISDRKKRQVVCTGLDGKFLWRQKLGRPFPKYSKALEDMANDYAGGICVHSNGNVLVCDTPNNRLTELSPDGIISHHSNLDLDKPAYVAANGGFIAIVNDATLLDCTLKVFRQSTTL